MTKQSNGISDRVHRKPSPDQQSEEVEQGYGEGKADRDGFLNEKGPEEIESRLGRRQDESCSTRDSTGNVSQKECAMPSSAFS